MIRDVLSFSFYLHQQGGQQAYASPQADYPLLGSLH